VWTVLGTVLATLATAILKAYWARQDMEAKVRLGLALDLEQAYAASLEWRVAALGDPAAAAELRSRGKRITVKPPAPPSP